MTSIITIFILILLPLLLGLLLGFAISYTFTAHKVAKSNDLGDSKGGFQDFATHPLTMRTSRDNVRLPIK